MRKHIYIVIYSALPALMIGYLIGGRRAESVRARAEAAHVLNENARLELAIEAHRHRRITEDRLGIRVVGAKESYKMGGFAPREWDACSEEEFLRLLPVILTELDAYPAEMAHEARLSRIVVCRNLKVEGKSEGGVADYAEHTIYLTADSPDSIDYHRLSVHHELMHMFDFVAGWTMGGDKVWRALNEKDFKYGPGGWAMSSSPEADLTYTAKYPGFLTGYSRAGVEEDKAELFSYLMGNPAVVKERMKNDAIVKAKVEVLQCRMRQFLPAVGKRVDEALGLNETAQKS